jgi:hypothetical protein
MTTMARKKKARPKAPLMVSDEERQTLERYDRGRTVSQALALRARIGSGHFLGQMMAKSHATLESQGRR